MIIRALYCCFCILVFLVPYACVCFAGCGSGSRLPPERHLPDVGRLGEDEQVIYVPAGGRDAVSPWGQHRAPHRWESRRETRLGDTMGTSRCRLWLDVPSWRPPWRLRGGWTTTTRDVLSRIPSWGQPCCLLQVGSEWLQQIEGE